MTNIPIWKRALYSSNCARPDCCQWICYLDFVQPQPPNDPKMKGLFRAQLQLGQRIQSRLGSLYFFGLFTNPRKKGSSSCTIPHICHFLYTGRIFKFQILHRKITQIYPKKSKICIFLAFNLEKFTPDRIFYTGSARGARDKYEVWAAHSTDANIVWSWFESKQLFLTQLPDCPLYLGHFWPEKPKFDLKMCLVWINSDL